MNAEAHPAIFLVTAVLMLLAIVAKLVTANLVTRSKRAFTRLDAARREIVGRLKEAQLKTTSAKGTLEFWERRSTETSQRVQDMQRDVETFEEQFAGELGDEGAGVEAGEADDRGAAVEADSGDGGLSGEGDAAAGTPPADAASTDDEAAAGETVPAQDGTQDAPPTDEVKDGDRPSPR